MDQLFVSLFCIGLLYTAIQAQRNATTFKWPAALMTVGSLLIIIAALFTIVFLWNSSDHFNESGLAISLLMLIPIGFITYLIGVVAYCVKTYTSSKANEELDYLNYQLKDQIKIATQKQASSSQLSSQ